MTKEDFKQRVSKIATLAFDLRCEIEEFCDEYEKQVEPYPIIDAFWRSMYDYLLSGVSEVEDRAFVVSEVLDVVDDLDDAYERLMEFMEE